MPAVLREPSEAQEKSRDISKEPLSPAGEGWLRAERAMQAVTQLGCWVDLYLKAELIPQ